MKDLERRLRRIEEDRAKLKVGSDDRPPLVRFVPAILARPDNGITRGAAGADAPLESHAVENSPEPLVVPDLDSPAEGETQAPAEASPLQQVAASDGSPVDRGATRGAPSVQEIVAAWIDVRPGIDAKLAERVVSESIRRGLSHAEVFHICSQPNQPSATVKALIAELNRRSTEKPEEC